ncbi:MAG TPA: outer membrane beta-barrel protein [Caulobacteraceae bacterium]
MKLALIAAASAATLAIAGFAAPALAQDVAANAPGAITWYGNLGYTGVDADHADLSAIDARLGARFGRYLGAEGEVAAGVNSSSVGGGANVRLNDEEAIYAVGYLPVSPKLDLLVRAGYGNEDFHFGGSASGHESTGSWNYGVGGQYFVTDRDGVRVDYTRVNTISHAVPDANTWGINWVHKF